MIYSVKLKPGVPTRNDVLIKTFKGKKDGDKLATTIVPGTLLKIEDESGVAVVTPVTAAATDYIFGIAGRGIEGYDVPVIVKGHCTAIISSTTFTTINLGGHLKDAKSTCACDIITVAKIKLMGEDGKEIDGYEVKK